MGDASAEERIEEKCGVEVDAVEATESATLDRDLPPQTPPPSRVESKTKGSLERVLFYQPGPRDLRKLAAIKRVLVHFTSIDPLGDYIAGEIEILDDRIKRDSFTAVVGALAARAHGAPLRSIARTLGVTDKTAAYPANNVVERSAHGMSGEVAGAEVTIGDEETMLERGVILDSFADTLIEDGQSGFYLLIAVGDSIIARCLITPPRLGDGREMVRNLRQAGVDVQIFSLGASTEALQCATDLGLSGEAVRPIESALHLDALLDQPEPFIVLTSDPDCAEYVARKGLVGFFSEVDRIEPHAGVFCFRSFDLRGIVAAYQSARKSVRKERVRWMLIAVLGLAVAGAGAAFLFR